MSTNLGAGISALVGVLVRYGAGKEARSKFEEEVNLPGSGLIKSNKRGNSRGCKWRRRKRTHR